jgi:acyl carrier protein
VSPPTDAEVRSKLLELLHQIAPDVDVSGIDPGADMREQTDVDSMDFLNLMLAVERELGVTVPETEYGKLDTLDAMVAYLVRRGATSASG